MMNRVRIRDLGISIGRYKTGQIPYSFMREDGKWISQLFEMTVEAVEEAIWNSICMATTTEGNKGRVREAIPYHILFESTCKGGILT
ncbi:P1 family peptidase [Neobacillus sp. NPDC097160]|uniref:P1 family peptidase n=1 Tax=Neobacillus sp. NPDC097160 TaxID=3364298 RepID=UPI00381D54E9